MGTFRFAIALKPYLERKLEGFKRPAMPEWIERIGLPGTTTSRYWKKIYWATPPWLNDTHIAQMRKIHKLCPTSMHIDHIVPLSSKLVCGLHVPWNLQYLDPKLNYAKSNQVWPDMPNENMDMFGYDTELDLLEGLRLK